jgi:type I restriction enzyme S subunit
VSELFLSLPVTAGIPKKRARFLFRVRSEKARPNDEQLAATQSHGVLSQKRYMEITGNKVVAALAGTENFNHVEQDDFVISLRTFEGGIERAAESGCISPAYTVLAPSQEVEPSFYQYLLKSQVFISHLQTTVTGIRDGKSVKFENFANIVLPHPELATQKAIADFLDRETTRIDQLIEKKQRLVDALKIKTQDFTDLLVTGHDDPHRAMRNVGSPWLRSIPQDWGLKKAKHLFRQMDRAPLEDDGVITAFRDGQVCLRSRRRTEGFTFAILEVGYQHISAGDLVIHSMDAFAGAIGVSEDDGKATGEYVVCTPRSQEANCEYYSYLLRCMARRDYIFVLCPSVRERAPRFRFVRFAPVVLPVPPRKEQDAIVERIEIETKGLNAVREKTIESIDRLREYRAALITAAVTGQIDPATHHRHGATDRALDRIEEEMQP